MSVADAIVEAHEPRTPRNCRCGWEGDCFTVHVIDMLCAASPDHFVTIDTREETWFVEHSMACRLAETIGTCEYNEAADLLAHDRDWSGHGRWRFMSLYGDNGFPELEQADIQGGEVEHGDHR